MNSGQYITVTWPELAALGVLVSLLAGVAIYYVVSTVRIAVLESEQRTRAYLEETYVRQDNCPAYPKNPAKSAPRPVEAKCAA